MTQDAKEFWREVIAHLKDYCKQNDYHLFYSSSEGWANVSYKAQRIRIRYTDTWFDIQEKLKQFTNDTKSKRSR